VYSHAVKIKSPTIPNLALQQVREAAGLTQEGFANLIDFSRAYIQAVELGQRDASSDFVRWTTMMTGVWPVCIAAKWQEAVGFDGEPYTAETYYRFKLDDPTPDSIDPEQIDALLEPAKRAMLAAAQRGKAKMACYYFREALIEATTTLLRIDKRIGDEFTGGEKIIGRLKIGDLRANAEWAARVGFVDNPRLGDDEVIPLEPEPKSLSARSLYPTTMVGASEGIEKKYRERVKARAK